MQTAVRWTLCSLAICFWAAILVPAFLLGQRRRVDPLIKLACRIECRLGGVTWTISGRERIPPGRYIFIANHVSMFDHFLLYGLVPELATGLEAAEHFELPIWGRLIRLMGLIPVSRSDPEAMRRALEAAIRRLREGYSVCVMPEGTRTLTGRLGPLKTGAFRMALETGTPVVPITFAGFWPIMRKGSIRVRPGHVHVHFEDPIPPGPVDDMIVAVTALWKRRLAEP